MSHAYLLVGQKDLLDIAHWISALILEQKTQASLIDERLSRLLEVGSLDVAILDGTSTSIKKEAVLNLTAQFSKTAFEKNQQKVAILHHAHNATNEALNSLLKSIEEPSGSETSYILTTDNLNQVLPTIVSRCVVLSLENINQDKLIKDFQELGLNRLSAYLISTITSNKDKALDISKEFKVEETSALVYDFFTQLSEHIDLAIINLQMNTPTDRHQVEHLFKMMRYGIKLALMKEHEENALIPLHSIESQRLVKHSEICLHTLSKINRSVYIPLLIDQFADQIREVYHD